MANVLCFMRFLFLFLFSTAPAWAENILEAYPPPAGSTLSEPDRYGAWLQQLQLLDEHAPILTHDGREVHHNGRPIDLDMVRGDLQQCADSAIRLRAEWLRETKAPVDQLMFYATSGDPLPWSRFLQGERPYVEDNRIKWRSGESRNPSWNSWLRAVFTWAGTRSLAAYETRPVESPQPGDMLVEPGSPGHAVVILNVATRGESTFLLLGEGYMPAQQFHVEHGPHNGWWEWRSAGLRLPAFYMPESSLRRWKSL